MTAHTGTHMDAPRHFLAGREGIETFPLSMGIGHARVISIPDVSVVRKVDLAGKGIQRGERILLRTRNSSRRWDNLDFLTDFVAIDASAAQYLADAGVAFIGVDYLSVGAFDGDGIETHRILLGAGVWIVEGLQLGSVGEGNYDMICLPLKIQGSDGAPARVVLRRSSTDLAEKT
jgi:arylformamidase